jgi:hypothetical protein
MESASRTEFAAIQQQTQNLSAQIAREREELETERRQLARERQTAPLVAEAIRGASLLAACLLPMLLGIYLLMPISPQAQTEALASLLIEQLAESPRGAASARLTTSLSE